LSRIADVPAISGLSIRPSHDRDIAAIAAIYAHHVRHGIASFEDEPPDIAEMARRREAVLGRGLPYIVAECGGEVLGYCYADLYRTRAAYRYALEDSIYIDHRELGRGIGRALLSRLLEDCAALGYRQMVAVIGGSEQWPSIGLHRALGFTEVGVLRAVGFKFDSWIDVILMQRALGPGATVPDITGVEHG
jgi:L-amino acid N-acyltransferase YncA